MCVCACCLRASDLQSQRDGNTAALVTRQPIAVRREAVLPCLVVPPRGLSSSNLARKGFKLPGGAKMTKQGEVMRRRRTIGARMALCK